MEDRICKRIIVVTGSTGCVVQTMPVDYFTDDSRYFSNDLHVSGSRLIARTRDTLSIYTVSLDDLYPNYLFRC